MRTRGNTSGFACLASNQFKAITQVFEAWFVDTTKMFIGSINTAQMKLLDHLTIGVQFDEETKEREMGKRQDERELMGA
jgi:hypothetical protein